MTSNRHAESPKWALLLVVGIALLLGGLGYGIASLL
jgi:hypothetical protein